MKANIGTIDRIIRILISVIVIVLYISGQVTGIAAIILLVVGAILIATSFVSFCPIYHVFGLSSKPKTKMKS